MRTGTRWSTSRVSDPKIAFANTEWGKAGLIGSLFYVRSSSAGAGYRRSRPGGDDASSVMLFIISRDSEGFASGSGRAGR